jgi:hypothetical protein
MLALLRGHNLLAVLTQNRQLDANMAVCRTYIFPLAYIIFMKCDDFCFSVIVISSSKLPPEFRTY